MAKSSINTIGKIGSKIDIYNSVEFSEVTKLIRKEIKSHFPAVKASVKIKRDSMCKSLYVTATYLPAGLTLYSDEYVQYAAGGYDGGFEGLSRYTDEAKVIADGMRAICNQYSHPLSDTSTESAYTHFFLYVDISDEAVLKSQIAAL